VPMGYYVDTMIGIRTGGVFSNGPLDMESLKSYIREVIDSLAGTPYEHIDLMDYTNFFLESSLSPELCARKGSYVVIAGIFNYWKFSQSSEFARRLSEKLGTEVMIMAWDEQTGKVNCQIFLDGKPLTEANEHPIRGLIRRMA